MSLIPLADHLILKYFDESGVFRRGSLEALPHDVLVNGLFPHLNVYDILRLRQVSRILYNATLEKSLWIRLLRTMTCPLHPLPANSRYSLNGLTPLELERLVTRSLSLENLWRDQNPDSFNLYIRGFNLAREILNMTILPGGRYLVASIRQFDRYSIMLLVMDHARGVIPLADTGRLPSKAFRIQAKYVPVNGQHGILISYVCRDYKNKKDKARYPRLNISAYSEDHDIDPEVPLIYECGVLHVSLASVEGLSHNEPGTQEWSNFALSQESPFRMPCKIRSRGQLGISDVAEVYGKPYLVLVVQPNTIQFKVISMSHVEVKLECMKYAGLVQFEHRILALRILPEQHEILVVRRIVVPGKDVFVIELYDIPEFLPSGELAIRLGDVLKHTSYKAIAGYGFSAAWITDPLCLVQTDESIQPGLMNAFSRRPICIYGRTVNEEVMVGDLIRKLDGFMRLVIWPETAQRTLPNGQVQEYCEYNLNSMSKIMSFVSKGDAQFRILPGCRRSVLFSSPPDDISDAPPIYKAFRIVDDECDLPKNHNLPAGQIYGYLDIPFQFGDKKWKAMAWDDTIGRLCISPEGSSIVTVVEFAKAPIAANVVPMDPEERIASQENEGRVLVGTNHLIPEVNIREGAITHDHIAYEEKGVIERLREYVSLSGIFGSGSSDASNMV
ncbi:unnamed protein product [Somion occarium]|uniref:F-box domain-containing protein n=1 Tax=Somion occarium TaxID=3059160 RepID=A0ABP1CFU7_9APHY